MGGVISVLRIFSKRFKMVATRSEKARESAASTLPDYSVFLPTYNEAENLPIVVSMLVQVFEVLDVPFEVIIVDDNSPDGTGEIAERIQDIYGAQRIVLAPREGKLGLGTAYRHALGFARAPFVIIMDCDLSHHPKYIPDLIAEQARGNFDIVIGSRCLPGGGVSGWDLRRKVVSRGANLLTEVMLQPRLSDITGSFRLYKKDALKQLVDAAVTKGYVFQMELITRARAAGMNLSEVPIVFVDRIYGESKMGVQEIVGFAKGLWYLFSSL